MKRRRLSLFVIVIMLCGMFYGCSNERTEYVLTKSIFYDASENYAGEIHFDDNGNVIKSTLLNEDGTVNLSSESRYEYDEYGNYVKHSYTSNTKSYIEEFEYEYDESGNIVACVGNQDGKSSGDYFYENGNLAKHITYDPEGAVLAITEYEYDEDGNLIKKTDSMAQAESKTIYEYFYDEHGSESGYTQTAQIGPIEQITSVEYENEYDANGNLMKQSQYQVTDGEKEFLGYQEFEYKEKEV